MQIKFEKKQIKNIPEIILINLRNDCLNIFSQPLIKNIKLLCKKNKFKADYGKFLKLNIEDRVFIIAGVGKNLSSEILTEDFGGLIYSFIKNLNFEKVQLSVNEIGEETSCLIARGILLSSYSFKKYFSDTSKEKLLNSIIFVSKSNAKLKKAFDHEKKLVSGVFFARDLVYEPANYLTPEVFAQKCNELKRLGIKVQIYNEEKLRKLGMNTLLAVGKGSVNKSYVAVMTWTGSEKQKPIALVGKGVCFDTGGISLKPAKGMEQMKFDMAGAAAVVGAMVSLAGQKIKKNVVGIVGLVENMPGGNAQRPGDVVKSMSGKTIEVINTDAEGRLVLADLLFYINKKYSPSAIIDLATLTGSIIAAIGKEYSGLFSNDDKLSNKIISSGLCVNERCWRMPLEKKYNTQLKSHIADFKNIGGPYAGSITAALFLEKFVGNTPWAHLDIAGVAWLEKSKPTVPTGGTGYGVKLLHNLIKNWK